MNLNHIDDNLLVVDYTDYRQQHPEEKLPATGVHFLEQPDSRLGSFVILNPNHVPYKVVNLEENRGLMTDSQGNLVSQCECLCVALREEGTKWCLMIELKYCRSEAAIPQNMQEALTKIPDCYDLLKNEKHFFDDGPYRVYACFSHPEYDPEPPFQHFINSENKLLELRERGILIIYSNAVKILTPEYVMAMDVPHKYAWQGT